MFIAENCVLRSQKRICFWHTCTLINFCFESAPAPSPADGGANAGADDAGADARAERRADARADERFPARDRTNLY